MRANDGVILLWADSSGAHYQFPYSIELVGKVAILEIEDEIFAPQRGDWIIKKGTTDVEKCFVVTNVTRVALQTGEIYFQLRVTPHDDHSNSGATSGSPVASLGVLGQLASEQFGVDLGAVVLPDLDSSKETVAKEPSQVWSESMSSDLLKLNAYIKSLDIDSRVKEESLIKLDRVIKDPLIIKVLNL